MSSSTASLLVRGGAIILVILFSLLADLVTRRFIVKVLSYLIARTETKKDDILLQRKVLVQLAHLAPALVVYTMAPFVLEGYDRLITLTTRAVIIYLIVIAILIADSLLSAFLDIYQTYDVAKEKPIKGFIQVLKIVAFSLGGIFIISTILDKTPIYFLSGIGALTAVLLLVFKDTILGFVAGVQLTANKMVAQGDWIEMPKYGADGDVIEVALTTVKVQNFDKTITTIPTYALISDSFKNWRGMKESGGRRIKRAVNIDINTIGFCTEEMLERFSRIQYISDYIANKKKELAEYNAAHHVDESVPVNGRRLTNIGTFRAYVIAYLKNHPMINQEMTFLVRQLPPGEHGLPIEIYVFCKDQEWASYEAIQADIFDHILSVVPQFDLRVFQNPSGNDFRQLAGEGK